MNFQKFDMCLNDKLFDILLNQAVQQFRLFWKTIIVYWNYFAEFVASLFRAI